MQVFINYTEQYNNETVELANESNLFAPGKTLINKIFCSKACILYKFLKEKLSRINLLHLIDCIPGMFQNMINLNFAVVDHLKKW